jgi:hypothetical protein
MPERWDGREEKANAATAFLYTLSFVYHPWQTA